MALLELKNVSKFFGGVQAVNDVSFSIEPEEIVGLIGPNGAGKTTIMNLITGLYPLSQGQIVFNGKIISGLKPHSIAHLGIARTFQIVKPFMGMTVKENVMMGALFRASRFNLNKNQIQNIVKNALDLVGLGEKADHPVEELNLAQRRVLEIARAIAMEPKLLLLDEAMAGLTPTEVQRLLDLVRTLNAQGMTVLLIEHVLKVVMNLSRRVLVLHYGRLIAEGSPQEIVNNPKVIEAYLGSKREGRIQGG